MKRQRAIFMVWKTSLSRRNKTYRFDIPVFLNLYSAIFGAFFCGGVSMPHSGMLVFGTLFLLSLRRFPRFPHVKTGRPCPIRGVG
jgi:hypothetical protein